MMKCLAAAAFLLQCYDIQFGRFLRGTIEMGAAEGRPPAFRVVRERREAGSWMEILAVDYRRVPK